MVTLTKPTVFPVWATQDLENPTSGQNNVTTPPAQYQLYGWSFQDTPPRNWFNWLGRYTNNWLQWLNQQESQARVVNNTGFNPAFDITNGGMALVYVIDTVTKANYYFGITYINPGTGSATPVTTISNNVLTVSTISNTGVITVSPPGNYVIYGQMKKIP